jgi:hypothetical protein
VGALLLSALAAVSACGGGSGITTAGASAEEVPASARSAENAAHSAEFLGARDALLREAHDPVARAEAERWLLSEAIDVTAPGDYVLKAGPLPASAKGDLEVGGGLTPVDELDVLEMHLVRGLKDGVDVGPRIVEENGQRFAVVPFSVTKVRKPYYGYRGWIEWRPRRVVDPRAEEVGR